ncbi:hypothetical protein GGE20_003158 [Rhizobium leguminosarum]|nr:hypothetical protein [Rhizobium leguminosarum]
MTGLRNATAASAIANGSSRGGFEWSASGFRMRLMGSAAMLERQKNEAAISGGPCSAWAMNSKAPCSF